MFLMCIFSLFPAHLVINVDYYCNHHGEGLQCKAGLEVEPSTPTEGLVAHSPAATATATAAGEEDSFKRFRNARAYPPKTIGFHRFRDSAAKFQFH